MSKDIFDLFKDNEHKLNQEPSPKAWSRIERRIQGPKPIARRRKMHTSSSFLSIAASLALVIGLISVISIMVGNKKQERAIAMNYEPFVIEALDVSTADVEIEKHTRQTQQQDLKPLKPINEGRAEQKLVAKSQPVQSNTAPHSYIDSTYEERLTE